MLSYQPMQCFPASTDGKRTQATVGLPKPHGRASLGLPRLNLIVSNGTYHDRLEKQRTAARIIFSPEELERIASFAEQARPENVTVSFGAAA